MDIVKRVSNRTDGKLVVLTGATGKLGRIVAVKLLEAGFGLRLIVRPGSEKVLGNLARKVQVIQADLSDVREIPILESACIGASDLVHVAGLVDFSHDQLLVWKANVETTRNLLAAAREAGNIRFILCSSTSVLRKPSKLPVDETEKVGAQSYYGQSKIEAERLVKESGLPYIILRPTMIYGPSFGVQFEPVIKQLMKGRMRIVGSGGNRMTVIHEDDCAMAFVRAVESKVKNETFIISNGPTLTQQQAIQYLSDSLGVNAPTKHVPMAVAIAVAHLQGIHAGLKGKKPSIDVDNVKVIGADRWFDTSKAKKMLGWQPVVDPKKGTGQMVEAWLKTNSAKKT